MGESTDLPAINEISHFLNEFAPEIASELAKRGSEYVDLIKIGVTGGKAKSANFDAESENLMGLRVRSDILNVALREAVSKANVRSNQIQSKLGALRLLRFLAGVCSAIGAMGAAGSALVGEKEWMIGFSLLTLASNVANVASTVLVLGVGRKEPDLVDSLRTLARIGSYASLTTGHLAAAASGGTPPSDMVAILKEANGQYRELNDALAKSMF